MLKKKRVLIKRGISWCIAISIILTTFLSFGAPCTVRAETKVSPHRYVAIGGYFGYWWDPDTGNYLYETYDEDIFSLGPDDPAGAYIIKLYTPVYVPPGEQMTNFMDYRYQWEGSDGDIGEWWYWPQQRDVDDYYAPYSRVTNGTELAGQSDVEVRPELVIGLGGIEHAHHQGNKEYWEYTCFVVEFTDNDYIDDPKQWLIDHGQIDPIVHAELDVVHPDDLTWNYREFLDNVTERISIDLDAGGTQSDFDIVSYEFKLTAKGRDFQRIRISNPYTA